MTDAALQEPETDRVIRAEAVDGKIEVQSGFRDKEALKLVPGHRWSDRDRVWRYPLSWAAMLQLRGVFGERLEIGPKLWELADDVRRGRVDPAMELRTAHDAPGRAELTPLQRVGAMFMATGLQVLNADPMGAGKCVMTIEAARIMEGWGYDPFPMLIVSPNGVKVHWRNEFATWWPEKEVTVIKGGAGARRKQLAEPADVHVINWESLRSHTRLTGYGNMKLTEKEKELGELNEMPFRTVVGDEAHRAKAPRSKQTRALWAVGQQAQFRFALTGTPIGNSPEDLWAVMHFVAPDEYPSKVAWLDRYGLLSWNPFGGMDVVGIKGETRDELFRFLDPRFLRRPKELILPDLREKLPTIVRTVEMPSKQRKVYDELRKNMLAELDNGVLMASNPLQQALRLKQLTGGTGVFAEDGKTIDLTEPSCKVSELIEICEEAPDESIAVFAESVPLLRLCAKRLEKEKIPHAVYTGDIKPDDREAGRVQFQNGEVRVILCTYAAGAEGVNLSNADIQLRLELHGSAIKNRQGDDRGHRMGGKDTPLRMIDVVAVDSVDDRIRAKYGSNLEKAAEIERDEGTLREMLAK